ncbi:argininosuccinate lyase [Clostridium sp. AN503]|uniref:argininosuccinate lyase n=1 Tax=Clostridium sp. AN503 TaxID=3160598 RepID=UPI00345B0827
MRKQTKVVAVASAAALLAIGASMTSFAATGWVEEDGQWYFYDKDGNRVEDEWKKSGDNWYWMDSEDNGAMATDKLVEDDDNTYYVDSNGVMVKNTWVKVVNEDQDDDDDPAEYRYYYMQSNGKAYKGNGTSLNKKTIDGKQYAFDEEGQMLYGWVNSDGDMANGEDDWQNATYYFGGWEDGSMKTGWQKITVHDPDANKDDDYDYWFNFKSNGKKRTNNDSTGTEQTNKTWKSNGKYYHFDARGVMVYQWYGVDADASSSNASAANWAYFNSPEDGARQVKGWFKVVAPTEDNTFLEDDSDSFATADAGDESERWYYSNGYDEGLVAGEIKKIKGKYYGFWPEDGAKSGRMLTGLCALKMNGSEILEVIDDDMDSDGLDNFMDAYKNESQADTNVYLYYFGDDADTDGAMKTGNVSINLDGDSYQFMFKKSGGAESRGRGVNGVDDKKYIYKHGQKVKASSDEKYLVVVATSDINDENAKVIDYNGSDIRKDTTLDHGKIAAEDGKVRVTSGFATSDNGVYLVNTSGKIQTSTKSGIKDGDDWYWYLNDGDIIMYTDSKDFDETNFKGSGWKNFTSATVKNDAKYTAD